MNICRLTVITLSLTLFVACGGGGGSSNTAVSTPTNTPTPENPLADLANFMPTTPSSIQAVQKITDASGVSIDVGDLFEAGSLAPDGDGGACFMRSGNCFLQLPGNSDSLSFGKDNLTDVSLIKNNTYFSTSNYSSEITNGITTEDIEGITFARGNLTGTRMADSDPLEFQTFAGWLNGSVFGVIQVSVGEDNPERRFISYGAGVFDESTAINPTATGTETTSATWTGATVATIKSSREFIFGDATIIVNFMDTNVDLMFDNWHNLNNQMLSSMQPITYEDVQLAKGGFSLRKNNNTEAFGRFYGTDHAEVGGWFNTETVTGAFGGTRQ